jgi:hypothetical protein
MSKRLQVVLPEEQYAEVAALARRRGLTIAEWVRGLLREACRRAPEGSPDRKIATIRAAYEHEFPTADIDEMLEQIESGYGAVDE